MDLLLAATPWLKFLHLATLMAWCGTLLGLPPLLALYPVAQGRIARRRVLAASRFVYIALASPAAVLAVASGTALIHAMQAYAPWLLAKLTLVAAMVMFHAGCGKLLLVLKDQPRRWSPRLLLALGAFPTLLIVGVLWLVLAQPALSLPRLR